MVVSGRRAVNLQTVEVAGVCPLAQELAPAPPSGRAFAAPCGIRQTPGTPPTPWAERVPSVQQFAGAIAVLFGFVLLAIGLRWWLGRRERALLRLLDSADRLEALLKETRARMGQLQQVVGRVPEDIGALARTSLDAEGQVQQALRDVLEHRLWIARHGESASHAQLRAALAALQRAHANIAEQLARLDRVGSDLAEVTQAAVEQAAREPSALRRGNGTEG